MPSILPDFEYDIFISYRHNDNRSGWVTEFVNALEEELAATIKEPLSIYFDKNPHDGLLETHNVDKSLEGKLKCLIFIPIISQTYCDPKSFAWQQEFVVFNEIVQADKLGRDIKLSNGNVASRILPVQIHALDAKDRLTVENEIRGVLRSIDFAYKEAGVNRPLLPGDNPTDNQNKTGYRNQVNKVANSVKELLHAITSPVAQGLDPQKKQFDALRREGISHARNKKLRWPIAIVALLLAMVGYYYYTARANPELVAESIEKSVAVMPFVNMSNNTEQEYFSDGLTEDIITELARIKSLKVTSRTTMMQYKLTPKPLKEVGEELGVATILEGSVQRSGDQLRITAQLINSETDEHLWAESYDRPVKDLFAVQREVATAIADVLKTTLSPKEIQQLEKLPTSSTTAYDYYLKGRYQLEKRERAEINLAIGSFEKAVAADPKFVEAISGLANAYLLLASRGWDDPKTAMPLAKKYVDQALQLAPESGPAHTALGYFLQLSYDYKGAEEAYRQSIEFEPNQNDVYNWLGIVREVYGDNEDAIAVYNQGLTYNPDLSIIEGTLKANLLHCLINAGRNDEALAMVQQNSQHEKPRAYAIIAKTYWAKGSHQLAVIYAEKSGDQTLISHFSDGDSTFFQNEALKKIRLMEIQLKNGEYVSMFALGSRYFEARMKNQAFAFYDQAIVAKDPHYIPVLKSTDPERAEIREKIMAVSQF